MYGECSLVLKIITLKHKLNRIKSGEVANEVEQIEKIPSRWMDLFFIIYAGARTIYVSF